MERWFRRTARILLHPLVYLLVQMRLRRSPRMPPSPPDARWQANMTAPLRPIIPRAALLAIGTALTLLSPGTYAGQLSDAQIMGIYIQVNGFDIDTALLGRSQAGSPA